MNSAAECCNEYPSFCTVPDKPTGIRADLRCLDLVPYESYTSKTTSDCAPKGWPQGNDDCWLDSSLYAMFGSRGWRTFSTLLDRMEESGGELTVLATQISNYLRRIDGSVLLDPNCKQQFKNSITLHYIKYFLKHLQFDDEESVNVFCQYQFTVHNGDVGRGDQDVMFRLFQRVADLSAVPCRFLDFLGYSREYRTLTNILDLHQYLFENETDAAVILNLKGITRVSSTSTDVMMRGKFSLVSCVTGNGPHVVARVKCHDSELWQLYDNMKLSTTNGVITGAILPTVVQHITLVYVREQTTLDAKPAPSSEAVATPKEAYDHGTPFHTALPSTGAHKLDGRRNGLSKKKRKETRKAKARDQIRLLA